MFKKLKEKIQILVLNLKYPFINPGWYKNKRYYSSTMLSGMPDAWQAAFGNQMLKDFKKLLKKNKELYKFRFTDVKEKYGTLRIYTNYTSNEIDELINYYEDLSMSVCCRCGKPSKYCTFGWIQYLCDDCGHKIIAESYLEEAELTWEDIPVRTLYKKGEETKIETKVDFKKIWKQPEQKIIKEK